MTFLSNYSSQKILILLMLTLLDQKYIFHYSKQLILLKWILFHINIKDINLNVKLFASVKIWLFWFNLIHWWPDFSTVFCAVKKKNKREIKEISPIRNAPNLPNPFTKIFLGLLHTFENICKRNLCDLGVELSYKFMLVYLSKRLAQSYLLYRPVKY